MVEEEPLKVFHLGAVYHNHPNVFSIRRNILSPFSWSGFGGSICFAFLVSDITELSEKEQLYIHVGKCLSIWNGVEVQILRLIEHASGCHASAMGLGYWAVVSFEARLKMCDAMIGTRLVGPKYADMAKRWNALNNKLGEKARKRGEIAHGSVVTFLVDDKRIDRFIPAFHRRLEELATLQVDGSFRPFNIDDIPYIGKKEIAERTASFQRLTERLNAFQADWLALDAVPQSDPKDK